MKRIQLLTLLLISSIVCGFAQTFSDNFDSYSANTFLGNNSTSWKTWTSKPGGADDIRISNAKSHSGSNSLYFNSVAANGGPADIVLPFGGELTSGKFNLSMYMFIDSDKKGYFNFQEQTTLGNGWSIDVNFDSIGGFEIVNTSSGILLSGTYPQNTWFKMDVNINLSSNTWDFLIDNVSKGTFQNSYRKIASMDIYPTFNSSYYIDDVAYTYTPDPSSVLNASLTYIDKVQGKLAGQLTTPVIEIRNLGTTPITSLNLELTYKGSTYTKSIGSLNIAKNALYSIPMDNSFNLAAGKNTLTATIKKVNGIDDEQASDNSKDLVINPMIPAPGKVVVAEEATGTWCTWCPRGAVFMRKMDEKYGEFFLGIAVHNNDPMKYANYDAGLGTISSGYPSMVVDRGPDIDPSAVEPDFLDRIVVAPKGQIHGGATYNAQTKVLKASLTTKFNSAVSGNYKIAFVLVEDSVTGSGQGWDQVNSYAGGSKGEMGGFEKLPNPVPASMMVYDHVGRVIFPNFKGLSNAFPATISANDSFTHNFTLTLDPSWKTGHISIVGLLIDPSGKIDNGSSTPLAQAIANGFVNGTSVASSVHNLNKENSSINIYPNPSSNIFHLNITSQIEPNTIVNIYTIDGKLIYSKTIESTEETIDASAWPNGMYLGTIQGVTNNFQFKLIRE